MRKLSPTKPKFQLENIHAFDIETNYFGELLDIGLVGDDCPYQTFTSWIDFLDYLANGTPVFLYAHNGGRFDVVNFIHKILVDGVALEEFQASLVAGSVMSCRFNYKNTDFEIRDSFLLLRSSLNDVINTFGVDTKKLDVPEIYKSYMGVYKMLYPNRYYEYLKHDVIGLYKVLKIFLDKIMTQYGISRLPLSVASLAMKVFKHNFLENEILIPPDHIQELMRETYSGGRCEYVGDGITGIVNKNVKTLNLYQNVNVIDVNSMYPAMMLNYRYPTGEFLFTNELEYSNTGMIFDGFYYCYFEASNNFKYAPILATDFDLRKPAKKLMRSGETWLTSVEIEYILKTGGTIEIIEGYYCEESHHIFKGFIENVYTQRINAKKSGDDVLDLLCKFILNNLYGKFAQKNNNQSIRIMNIHDILDSELTLKFSDDLYLDSELQMVICEEQAKFRDIKTHPLIAALVTARARCYLHETMETIGNIIYCDTDSIFTQNKVPEHLLSNSVLGRWKLEYENIHVDLRGKKSYVLYNNALEVIKLKQKGAKTTTIPKYLGINENFFSGYNISPRGVRTMLRKSTENPSMFRRQDRTFSRQQSSKEQGL